MEQSKVEQFKKFFTFDETDYPDWKGAVGKCFVDDETEVITIVGWWSDMGSTVNNYRLVIEPKSNARKSWISCKGFTDTGKSIGVKVDETTMDEALVRMLNFAKNENENIEALVAAIVDVNGEFRSRSVGRPVTVAGKRVQVYLDAASLKIAAKLGGGNTSEGIRVALKKVGEPT